MSACLAARWVEGGEEEEEEEPDAPLPSPSLEQMEILPRSVRQGQEGMSTVMGEEIDATNVEIS